MKPRHYTEKFLEEVEDGIHNHEEIILAFCKYLSEDEVKDFLRTNELMDIDDGNES